MFLDGGPRLPVVSRPRQPVESGRAHVLGPTLESRGHAHGDDLDAERQHRDAERAGDFAGVGG